MPRKKVVQKPQSNTTFILKNVDIQSLLIRHYITDGKELTEHETIIDNINEEDVNIATIMHEKPGGRRAKRADYHIDSYKQQNKYWINMIDIIQNGALPRYSNNPCWWCRSTFKSHPIGCPVRYCLSEEEKRERVLEKFKAVNLPTDDNADFFETEGIFCTFPCVKAYILDQIGRTQSSRYKESLTLLTLLYQKIFGEIIIIPPAPSWKLLSAYGGHLTPSEFRESASILEYKETVNIRRPFMYSTGEYILEKKIRV